MAKPRPVEIRVADGVFLRTRVLGGRGAHIWFLHGFGESGLCFREAFEAGRLKGHSLFAPDCPGFGASPAPAKPPTVKDSARTIEGLIRRFSRGKRLVLVGHSLGGILGTYLCESLGRNVLGFVSVEGNLTRADTFYTSQASGVRDPVSWKREFCRAILLRSHAQGREDRAMIRYLASLMMADPRAFVSWGRSCVSETGRTKSGDRFLALGCPRTYFYGRRSIPPATERYLRERLTGGGPTVPAVEFRASGHWPMYDETEVFYKRLSEFIAAIRK
ncbi:MAG: alpha/beta hydrolase [Elusimicrobiota bacterium]